jgi:hypothetical protein
MLLHTHRLLLESGTFTATLDTAAPLRVAVALHGGCSFVCETPDDDDTSVEEDALEGDVSVLMPVGGERQLEGLRAKCILWLSAAETTLVAVATTAFDESPTKIEIHACTLDTASDAVNVRMLSPDVLRPAEARACVLGNTQILAFDMRGSIMYWDPACQHAQLPVPERDVLACVVKITGDTTHALAVTSSGMLMLIHCAPTLPLRWEALALAQLKAGHVVCAAAATVAGATMCVLLTTDAAANVHASVYAVNVLEPDARGGILQPDFDWQLFNDAGTPVRDVSQAWLSDGARPALIVAAEDMTCWLKFGLQ